MSDVVRELSRSLGPVFAGRTHPLLLSPSINLGRIAGGATENLVATRCRLTFDRRMLPGETFDQAEGEIREVVERVRARDAEAWTFELRGTLAVPALEIHPGARIVRETGPKTWVEPSPRPISSQPESRVPQIVGGDLEMPEDRSNGASREIARVIRDRGGAVRAGGCARSRGYPSPDA